MQSECSVISLKTYQYYIVRIFLILFIKYCLTLKLYVGIDTSMAYYTMLNFFIKIGRIFFLIGWGHLYKSLEFGPLIDLIRAWCNYTLLTSVKLAMRFYSTSLQIRITYQLDERR